MKPCGECGMKYYEGTGCKYSEEQLEHMRRECAEYIAKDEEQGPDALIYAYQDLLYHGHTGWKNMPAETVIKFWEREVPPDYDDFD